MKKMTFLAVSVAMALTGCGGGGGSDSSGQTTAQSTTITGFDGYFKQAVLFDDVNNDGVLTVGTDIVFGLTDANGQYQLTQDVTGTLALQTLTPGGNAQSALADYDAETYAGKYTIDMDSPSQAMAHEVVFRAPTSSTVVSPITDLVAIKMSSDSTLSEDEAKAAIAAALGLSDSVDDVYSDFVSGAEANSSLHKVAQMLTESKAAADAASQDYEELADTIVEAAKTTVDSMDETELASTNYVPVVTIDEGTTTIASNYQMTADGEVVTALQEQLSALNISEDDNFAGLSLDVSSLFSDEDNASPTVSVNETELGDSGITLTASSGTLVLGAVNPVADSGEFTITLQASDLDSQKNIISTKSVVLTVTITASNQAPVVVTDTQTTLQTIVDGWQLQQGTQFEQTLSLASLFSDVDGEITEYESGSIDIEGLTLTIDQSQAIATISGTPTQAYSAGVTFQINARDEDGAASQAAEFTLPEVLEGQETEVETHSLEGTTWYRLEHGSSNGSTEQNYSSVWCDTFRFEDGLIYENVRSSDNLTQCSEATQLASGASYVVDGDNLVATFYDPDEGGNVEVTLSVSDASAISSGAQTLLWTVEEDGEAETERYTFFSNIDDAEARIQLKSDDDGDTRYFPMILPTQKRW
ncbi:Ig-like domain-containing protein [Vibrio sp. CDRSL-10 TSBA]